jgi:hypothetical protein
MNLDFRETGFQIAGWIHLAYVSHQWRDLVNTVMMDFLTVPSVRRLLQFVVGVIVYLGPTPFSSTSASSSSPRTVTEIAICRPSHAELHILCGGSLQLLVLRKQAPSPAIPISYILVQPADRRSVLCVVWRSRTLTVKVSKRVRCVILCVDTPCSEANIASQERKTQATGSLEL